MVVSMVDIARKRVRHEHRCWCALARVLLVVMAAVSASCELDIDKLASAGGAAMVVAAA